MKVLLVDDESHVIEGMTRHIPWTQWGIEDIQTAQNGADAWELYQHYSPDLIITDIIMPKMNGLEFIRNVRRHDHDTPIVILSGYDDFAFAREAIGLEVTHYILKPIVSKEIVTVLQQIFDDLYTKQKKDQWVHHAGTYIHENIADLREQFVHHLITRGARELKFNEANLNMLDISDHLLSGGAVMTLQIFPPSPQMKSYSTWDWQLLKYAVKNIVQELGSQQMTHHYTTPFTDYRLSLLYLDTDPQRVLEQMKSAAHHIIKNIHRFLKLESNVGIGHWYADRNQYIESYHESITALQHGEYEGFQRLDWIGDISGDDQTWPSYPVEDIQQITEAVLHRDAGLFKERWSEFVSTFADPSARSMEYVQSVCIGLINSIVIQLMETKNDASSAIALSALQAIPQMKTKQSLLERIEGLLLDIIQAMSTQTAQGPEYYIDYLKKYIAKNYSRPITFSELANQLHVNRVYLGNLFKRETGETFVNYLTLHRIEQAKKLIVSKNFMIFEIAEMVGYTDSAYFSRVFKNYTGVTPTEYLIKAEQGRLSEA